jgi:hypothetical protein
MGGSNEYGVGASVGPRLWCGMVGHDTVGRHRSGPAAQNLAPDSLFGPHCVWLPSGATEWLRQRMVRARVRVPMGVEAVVGTGMSAAAMGVTAAAMGVVGEAVEVLGLAVARHWATRRCWARRALASFAALHALACLAVVTWESHCLRSVILYCRIALLSDSSQRSGGSRVVLPFWNCCLTWSCKCQRSLLSWAVSECLATWFLCSHIFHRTNHSWEAIL